VVHPPSKCFDGAERPHMSDVVHGAASLSILLVVNVEASGVGKEEFGQGSRVW
jgi:hypothetical protein